MLPIFLDALDPNGEVPEADLGVAVASLLERNEIRLEIYALALRAEERQIGRILLELEEARQKALREDFGAELATAITVTKGQLLGIEPMPLAVGPLNAEFDAFDYGDGFMPHLMPPTETYH